MRGTASHVAVRRKLTQAREKTTPRAIPYLCRVAVAWHFDALVLLDSTRVCRWMGRGVCVGRACPCPSEPAPASPPVPDFNFLVNTGAHFPPCGCVCPVRLWRAATCVCVAVAAPPVARGEWQAESGEPEAAPVL